jgi:tripartite-type tricarboxylate transporter receptor subunit TctC
MLDRRRFASLAAAFSATAATGANARAQSSTQVWPARNVRFVVPVAAGGSIDGGARIVAGKLSEIWGRQVVVENKPGAGNNIAAEMVARSEPDGYTAYVAPITIAVNRFLYPSLNYDPVADFAPVSLLGHFPNIMVVPMSLPARSVKEFIAHARTHRLSYASGGAGSSLHLAGELFKRLAHIEMTHVPYRGAAPAFGDLIPGRVHVMFNLVPSSLPLVRSGQLRGLAVTTAQRLSVAPEIPTVDESGLPGFVMTSWLSLFLPARTAPDIITKMSSDTVAALADPAVRAKLESQGVVVAGTGPAELAAHLKAEMERWSPIIKAAGITSED